jgi:glycosyltransferase involved in cell wall biosynthesis
VVEALLSGGPVAVLGPSPPDRGGIARETALLVRELSCRTPVRYFTFSRPYPRWLDPRRFPVDPSLPRTAATPLLDYASPGSWGRAAEKIAGDRALLVPWWTAFWGLPVRALFRRLAALSPLTSRVLLCHNVEDHESGLVKRFLALGAFLSAGAFVVHSEEDRGRLERLAPARSVLRLPHPVEPSPPPDREEARRRLRVEGRLVLFLGLVRRYKGVDLLLAAAPRILAETGARIAVVGEIFPDARDLRRRARLSPAGEAILWKDEYVSEEEMGLWLAACDAVVLPYRSVSGSGIAARAIAARRPVVASAVGGLRDSIEPGVMGELFAPGDAEGLASAVSRALERGIAAYQAGLERAAERASWASYVDRLLTFLDSIGRPKES